MIKQMKRMNQNREIGLGSSKIEKKIMCSGILEQSSFFQLSWKGTEDRSRWLMISRKDIKNQQSEDDPQK